jgi:hypothetical protein
VCELKPASRREVSATPTEKKLEGAKKAPSGRSTDLFCVRPIYPACGGMGGAGGVMPLGIHTQ